MATSPANRAHDIFRRMEENVAQSETIKTCFGILAIMSRDETNKVMIAVDGMECILNVMMANIDKPDVQEAGCDLLWSLAFNNAKVKEIIGKYGGTTILVRGLKRHSKSADFLKSACGALSNLCQSKANQQGFSSHGGIQPLVGAINFHQGNAKLLPFIFDALASLIVGNEENAKMMSSQEGIVLILSTLSRLKTVPDVVKSGCHALAILSDVKGQANKIALAGGVIIILSLLDIHPSFADFHRVAAVVLLRMLQETPIVSREITSNEGVRILLKSLDKGGALEDTVAAVTHILSSITSPLNTNAAAIEAQLWLSESDVSSGVGGDSVSVELRLQKRNKSMPGQVKADSNQLDWQITSRGFQTPSGGGPTPVQQTSALGGLVRALGVYTERRDVVRAGCRLLSHLIGFAGVVMALDSMSILDRIFDCVAMHSETRDVLESAASLLKAIHRRTAPTFHGSKTSSVRGLMAVFRYRINDDDVVTACVELLVRYHSIVRSQSSSFFEGAALSIPKVLKASDPGTVLSQMLEPWEHESLGLCLKTIELLLGTDNNAIDLTTGLIKCLSVQRKSVSSSSRSTKMINAVLTLIEKISTSNRGILNSGSWEQHPLLNVGLAKALSQVSDTLTPKYSDIIRRIEVILPNLSNRIERPTTGTRPGGGSASLTGSAIIIRPIKGFDSNSATVTVNCRPMSSSSAPGGSSAGSLAGSSPRQPAPDSARGTAVHVSSSSSMPPVASSAGELAQSKAIEKMDSVNPYGQLLSTWPVYLEKIITTQQTSMSRALEDLLKGSSSERMHIVYESKSAAGVGIPSKCPAVMPYSVPEGGVGRPFDHSIKFDSEFESGNLLCAVQRGEKTYDLCLRPDLHTPGHTQWFYFAVTNVHPPNISSRAKLGLPVNPFIKVTFNIINFTKPDSSFNSGMKPVVYSLNDALKKQIGWVRQGSDISYCANEYVRQNSTAGEGVECYFTLSFTLEFNNIDDTYLVAYSYPYTYTDHRLHMRSLLDNRVASDVIRHARLCLTLGGKECDLLIITNFRDKENVGPLGSSITPVSNILPGLDAVHEQFRNAVSTTKGKGKGSSKSYRKAIFISSRVHPGETPASWVMKGALDFLTGDSQAAQLLRQNFVFFIVPMLNPDGVIFGNNRCSLAGVDLNRQWKTPSKSLHPTVFYLKTLIQEQKYLRDVVLYIDIHGHSRKYNVFLYGCDDKKRPFPKAREFPRIFSQHEMARKYVSYDDCSFHIKKSRESTARVVVCRELNVPYSYTIEATFCGPDMGPLRYYHMNIGHLQDCGAAMCDSILQFSYGEGLLPEGTILPEAYRGMARIDLNSYGNPLDEKFRKASSVQNSDSVSSPDQFISKELADMSIDVNDVGSKPGRDLPSSFSGSESMTLADSDIAERKQGQNRGESTDADEVQCANASGSDEESEDAYDGKRAEDGSSSDEDEDPEADRPVLDGSFEESSGGGGDEDEVIIDDAIADVAYPDDGAGEYGGAENGEVDSATSGDVDHFSETERSRTGSVSPIVEDIDGGSAPDAEESERNGNAAKYRAKARPNLRTLIDEEKHNMAGSIASQRVPDGIAARAKPDANQKPLMDAEM
jgi:hypothetical protein